VRVVGKLDQTLVTIVPPSGYAEEMKAAAEAARRARAAAAAAAVLPPKGRLRAERRARLLRCRGSGWGEEIRDLDCQRPRRRASHQPPAI
jgi:hypothetical protein